MTALDWAAMHWRDVARCDEQARLHRDVLASIEARREMYAQWAREGLQLACSAPHVKELAVVLVRLQRSQLVAS